MGQGVEVGEDLAALGAEGVGVVEDRGDPPLLGERWKRQPDSPNLSWASAHQRSTNASDGIHELFVKVVAE